MIKRLLPTLAVTLLMSNTAAAQSRPQADKQRFSYSGSIGVGLPLSQPKATPVTLRLGTYYNLGCRWALGAGSGASFYDHTTLVPLFGEVRFGLTRPRHFTPYLSCAAGYAFAPARGVDGGLLVSPAIGVQWQLRPRLGIHLCAGYELQKFARIKTGSDPMFDYGFREELTHHSLMIRAGVTF